MNMSKHLAVMLQAFYEKSEQSKVDFSASLEVSRTSMSDYLSGAGNPRLETVQHLADKLEVEPSVLLFGMSVDSQTQADALLAFIKGTQLLAALTMQERREFVTLAFKMLRLLSKSIPDLAQEGS